MQQESELKNYGIDMMFQYMNVYPSYYELMNYCHMARKQQDYTKKKLIITMGNGGTYDMYDICEKIIYIFQKI